MKILHIETKFHPSYGYQVQQLVRNHSKEHEVVIVTSNTFGGLRVDDSQHVFDVLDREYEQETGSKIIRLNVTFEIKDKIYMKDLIQVIDEQNPDVIFSHGVEYLALMQLVLSGRAKLYPLITDCHDLPTAAKNKWLRNLYRFPLSLTSLRFVRNNHIKCYYVQPQSKLVLETYRLPEDCLDYLPLGVDTDIFHPSDEARRTIRAEYGFKNEDVIVVYTGKQDADKDPALILDAYCSMGEQERCKIKILMIGARDESYQNGRLNVYQHLVDEGVVYYLEPIPFSQLAGYYSAADIGIFPLKNTMSALDAMACELPLIMQEDQTNNERLEKAGLTYKMSDVQDLKAKMLAMVDSREARDKMGAAGIEFVKGNHGFPNILNKLESDMKLAIQNHQKK